MPNEYSNFTVQDTDNPSGGYQAPPAPQNVNAEGYVWDPGSKQWVKAGSNQVGGTQTAGNASTTGMPAPGVNGLMPIRAYDPEAEKDRYRGMANPLYGSGPAIDHSVSDGSRGLSLDALSQLRARAQGAVTPAQRLAQQQTQGAVNGIASGAASIRGGAGARAAAARGAAATGARVGAQGAQDEQALRAREMADASNQYFGASSAQRDRDIGSATEQAKLDAQQRVANEQRSENYEGLAYGTQVENVNNARGASAEQASASNASRNAGLAEDAAAMGKIKDVGGAITGGAAGAGAAYEQTRQPEKSGNPWDPDNYSGSDPQMKRKIHAISDKEAARLNTQADSMLAAIKAHGSGAPEYEGKYLGSPFPSAPDMVSGAAPVHKPKGPSLHEAMASATEGADPYRAPEPDAPRGESLFGGRMGETAPKSYAAMRAGHEGSMFGASPKADYTAQLWGDEAGEHTKARQWAPGSSDFYAGKEGRAARDRDVALSDPRAKEAARWEGSWEGWNTGYQHAVDDANEQKRQAAVEEREMSRWAERRRLAPHTPLPDPPTAWETTAKNHRKIQEQVAGDDGKAVEGNYDKAIAAKFGPAPQPAPQPAPPVAAAPPGFDASLQDRFGAPRPPGPAPLAMSDPRAKTDVHDNPMADANRSMAPSSYEYKPEFTPPEQQTGEVNVGPMADKMEANPVAKTAIVKDPQTGLLAIDKTKGLKLVMGGLADLQRQVDRMRGARQ